MLLIYALAGIKARLFAALQEQLAERQRAETGCGLRDDARPDTKHDSGREKVTFVT